MKLALTTPTCDLNGNYHLRQCRTKKVLVTPAEQKQLLEEKNVRQMKSLLQQQSRQKRSSMPDEKIQLVPLRQASESLRSLQDLNIRNLVEFLRHRILDPIANAEELSFADMILKDGESEGRTAKVIDISGHKSQGLNSLEKSNKRNFAAGQKKKEAVDDNQLVEVEVESCWCVDSFGTAIPNTIGSNTTEEYCMR